MSASLIVLIPVALLGLVAALCFVGCGLNTHGFGPNFGPYENSVFNYKNSIALWPLSDTVQNLPTATNIINPQFNGTYPDAPMGPNSFMVQQPGIVPGDVNNGLTPCASFNGGFVTVGFQQALNPATFTLEAWVKPNWTAAGAQHAVVVSGNLAAGAGYGLIATPDNFWEVNIGIPGQTFFVLKATDPIDFTAMGIYLAVTYDGTMLTLFVGNATLLANNTIGTTFTKYQKMPPSFVAEDSSTATPLFIGMGRPDTTSGMFPFNGSIQDVAFYSPPLSATDVQTNFTLGSTPLG